MSLEATHPDAEQFSDYQILWSQQAAADYLGVPIATYRTLLARGVIQQIKLKSTGKKGVSIGELRRAREAL